MREVTQVEGVGSVSGELDPSVPGRHSESLLSAKISVNWLGVEYSRVHLEMLEVLATSPGVVELTSGQGQA